MTSTVEVDSDIIIENNEIDFYADNALVGKLNDNGLNGDKKANDGVFSGTVSLYSDTRKRVDCFAKYKNYISETSKLSFIGAHALAAMTM